MRTSQKKILFGAVRIAIGGLLLVLMVYPMFYVIMSSMKTTDDFRHLAAWALPSSFNIANYVKVFTTSPMLTYFKNSIIITVGTLIPLVLFSFMAGFALSKIEFKWNKKLLNYFMLGLMLPFQVALIPLFTIFSNLGILNTYGAVILPQIAFSLSYSIQLFYSFCKFLPDEIVEAAIIDGGKPFTIFFRIIFPMSTNSILTVATMQGVFTWNDFINAYTFTRSTTMKTVTLGLNDFVGFMGTTDWGATFAAIVVTTIPTFLFYFLTSKYMTAGLTAGAVKG